MQSGKVRVDREGGLFADVVSLADDGFFDNGDSDASVVG